MRLLPVLFDICIRLEPTVVNTCCARSWVWLCASKRITTAKRGYDTFSCASFGISGASLKNESPPPTVTERKMLSDQGFTAPLNITWSTTLSPCCRCYFTVILPTKKHTGQVEYVQCILTMRLPISLKQISATNRRLLELSKRID